MEILFALSGMGLGWLMAEALDLPEGQRATMVGYWLMAAIFAAAELRF